MTTAQAGRGELSPDELDTVAVIVPVHASPTDLRVLAASMAQVRWPRERLQVVVAVDGPHPETEKVAHELADTVVVLPVNQGSYAARQAALAQVRSDAQWVAFTDADCVVGPDWLVAHAEALRVSDCSGGDIRVTLRPSPSPAEVLDKARHLKQEQYVAVEGFAATANLAVRRQVVDQLGFQTHLRSGGDADFGKRAREAGFSLVFTRDAWVEHPARQTTSELLRKVRRICAGIESNPRRWADRTVPRPTLSLFAARTGYREGYTRSPWWMLRAVLLHYRLDAMVYRSARRTRRRARQA